MGCLVKRAADGSRRWGRLATIACSVPLFLEKPELLPPFQRGDRAALEQVYRRYLDDVTRLLQLGFQTGIPPRYVAGLSDRPALRDATQEVFVRAFQESARRSYDPSRPYRPYLLRIARNLRIDQLRSRGRELPVSAIADGLLEIDELMASSAAELPASAAGAQASREWETLQGHTRQYVSELAGPLRQFLELRFAKEHSQQEVAASMGVTRRQVRTWESQVLAGLRRYLSR